jgi:MerR family redox-sensitive transcriptional activator SoxR
VDEATLTIGQVARRAGLKTSAIRYSEALGILPEARRESGQRRYGDDTLRRLRVIDVAKRAGFSLDELIARAQAMRAWLVAAHGCDCETLDVCALFDTGSGAGGLG